MGVSVAYMPKTCIHNYYHGVSVFEKIKDQSFTEQGIWSGKMDNSLFETYKNLSYRMVSISFKQPLTRQWQQFLHIHNLILLYHLGNVC